MLNQINSVNFETNAISSEAGVKIIHPAFVPVMFITSIIS